jgi:Zn-finger nucleic acid-binding protein
MKCPRDGATLTNEKYEGVVVDRCPSCGGIWLDSGELRTIQETIENDYSTTLNKIDLVARAHELARQQKRPEIDCPKCGGHLNPREYSYCSQILIDRCEQCGGVWLDSGELQALEQFFETAAEEEKAEREAIRLGFIASLWQRLP